MGSKQVVVEDKPACSILLAVGMAVGSKLAEGRAEGSELLAEGSKLVGESGSKPVLGVDMGVDNKLVSVPDNKQVSGPDSKLDAVPDSKLVSVQDSIQA